MHVCLTCGCHSEYKAHENYLQFDLDWNDCRGDSCVVLCLVMDRTYRRIAATILSI